VRHGHSLLELVITLTIVSVVTSLAVPRVAAWLDWIAVEGAAQDFTTAVSITRNRAVRSGLRVRLEIERDSFRMYQLGDTGWVADRGWVGPAQSGVSLVVSNKTLVFDPVGLGVGASNTRVVFARGLHTATFTMSRLGRIKRW